MAATAQGRRLAEGSHLRLREKELAAALAAYRQLPSAERQAPIADPREAAPPQRPAPVPPRNGLVVRGYCTYMRPDDQGKMVRSKEFYYKENPDRWAAETQSDMLWLTEAEGKSLVPDDPKAGQRLSVAAPIQRRFFSTIGIDYMEGSVNSLPSRETTMTLTVESVSPDALLLRLDGYGRMGEPFDAARISAPRSRGCELRVLGFLSYDRRRQAFAQFDLVGVGEAWGNKMDYTRREVRLDGDRWRYGIACELVQGDSSIDRIPPYNLLHYGSAGPYFGDP